MPKLIVLVGPPGSGKSTFAHDRIHNDGDHGSATVRISQDDQGKPGHMQLFMDSIHEGKDIIVDRMNFDKKQRANYLNMAKAHKYETEIIVIHESYSTCLKRMEERKDHPTIKDRKAAHSALGTFFTKYERPEEGEADKIKFIYPEGKKTKVIVCDLDGTLCNVEWRRHHVRVPEGQKKNWPAFFDGIPNDPVNKWCMDILLRFSDSLYPETPIVFCSGRSDDHRKNTVEWLDKHCLFKYDLYMRHRHDSRHDYIIKEILLDFELLTRYEIYFTIDDRKQVVDMWRKRGFVCLACDEGDF